MLVQLLIFIVIYFLIIYFIVVCMDSPNLWDCISREVKMPTISDLELRKNYTQICDAETPINEYINDVILPSHDYFKLKEEIKKKIHSSEGNALVSLFFAFIIAVAQFSRVFKTLDIAKALCIFLVAICSIALVIISFLLSRIIYQHTGGKIRDFHRDAQWYKNHSDWYIIREHKQYLESIKIPIFHRNTGSVIMATLTFILQVILWVSFC